MKTTLYTLVIALFMVSCKTEPKIDYVIIKGTITNAKPDSLLLRSILKPFSKKIAISNEGVFVDTLKVENKDNYMLLAGGRLTYLFLGPGDEINITYDHDDYKNTINFIGNAANVNNYLIAKSNKEKEILGEGKNVYELEESDFKATQKEINKALLELLSSTKGLTGSYKEKEKRSIEYSYLSNLSNYESYHAYYSKIPDFKVSEGFLKELDGIDYTNYEDFLFSSSYNNLLRSYFTKEAEKLSKSDSIAQDVAYLKTVNTLGNQDIINDLLYANAKYGITYTSDIDGYYEAFMNGSTNEEQKKEITENYNILKTVAKGKPSPKFIDYENNAGGTMSLDDLKGQYVYIDVWATWCGPCKAEIPFLKKVEEQYHSKNITFVSISVDRTKDHDKWKQLIKDENLGGIQLLADKDFESQFVQDYLIKGIPRFILIDTNGLIINSNAPRPSSQNLIELFNEYNI